MYSMLHPWLEQRMLESSRVRLMHKIERQRGSRVILLVHRQGTMSFLGFPVFRYIDVNDAEEVIRAIRLTDADMPIDLVLHTPGGLVLASLQIARAVKAHKGKVRVFVPHYAVSGGTLIALAAAEIVMDGHAVLGPVDPQLGEYPAASLLKVVKTKDVNEVDDHTLRADRHFRGPGWWRRRFRPGSKSVCPRERVPPRRRERRPRGSKLKGAWKLELA
jgi:ClpP class serine protease